MGNKYLDTINYHFELGLFRLYFPIFSLDSAAICLKNGSSSRKIPAFIPAINYVQVLNRIYSALCSISSVCCIKNILHVNFKLFSLFKLYFMLKLSAFLSLTIMFNCTIVQAQLSNVQWLHSMVSPSDPTDFYIEPMDFFVDATGNSYFLGATEEEILFDNGTLLATANGSVSLTLVKYNKDGNLLWSKSIGGPLFVSGGFESYPFGKIAVDKTGNIFLYSNMPFEEIDLGNGVGFSKSCPGTCEELFVAKFNGQGDAQWVKTLLPQENTSLTLAGIGCDAIGNVYLAGQYEGVLFTYDNTIFEDLPIDGQFVFQLDNNGTLIWHNEMSESSNSRLAQSFATMPDGSCFVGGFYVSPIDFGNGVSLDIFGTTNYYIVKYNNEGKAISARNLNSSSFIDVLDIEANAQGKLYVVCDFEDNLGSDGNDLLISSTDHTCALIVLENAGFSIPLSINNSDNSYAVACVATTADNKFYTGGFYEEDALVVDNTILSSQGCADILLISGSENTLPEAVSLGGQGCEGVFNFYYGNAMGVDAKGFLYMMGVYVEGGTIGAFTPENAGIFVAKVNTGTVSSKEAELENELVQINPNPNNGSFTLQAGNILENSILKLTDMHGKTVLEQVVSGQTQQINHNLPNGCYSMSIQNGKQYQTVKVIVAR
jgi:hypothetical protein